MAGNSDTAVPTEKAVVTYAESLVGTDGSGVLGYKNKFINGNFDIWQRGTSFSANGYTADRWKLYIVGDSMTITKEAHTTGQTDVPGNPVYYLKAANTLAAGASNLSMILYGIEDVNIFAGETVTMSFYAKAAAGTPRIAISISQNFGGGGSAAVATYGGVTTLSTSWEKHTITMAIPSISGKTVGSSSYTQIQIWLSAGSDFDAFTDTLGQQSIEVSFSEMQIESGSVATQFDRRHVAQELAMCQRYYTIVTLTPLYLLGLLTTAIYFPYIFPQQMRIAPTMSVVTQVTYYSGGSGVNITPTFYAPDGRGFSLYLSSLTNGNGIAGGVVAAYADF
jgi:hypothetical protein